MSAKKARKDPKGGKGLPPGKTDTPKARAREGDTAIAFQDFGPDIDAERAERICQAIETTPRGLDHICDISQGLPSSREFYRWLESSLPLRQRYARAKEVQADLLAFQAVEIADTPRLGVKTKTGEKGTEVTEGDMVEHRRLQVDTRKWLAGKLAPKKYGDKVEVEQTGEVVHRLKFT